MKIIACLLFFLFTSVNCSAFEEIKSPEPTNKANEEKLDLLTSSPLLPYISSFLANPYPLLSGLNRRSREIFQKNMPIQLFTKLRFNIPELSNVKCNGYAYELHSLLDLSNINEKIDFFHSLATDVFSNGLYEEYRDAMFKYVLRLYDEFSDSTKTAIDKMIPFQKYLIQEMTRLGDYRKFFDILKVSVAERFFNAIHEHPGHVFRIYKQVAQNEHLLARIRDDFNTIREFAQLNMLADLILAGAPKDFYLTILRTQNSIFVSKVFDLLIKKAIYNTDEDGIMVKYEEFEELIAWFEQQNQQNGFNEIYFVFLRIRSKILFSRLDDNFYTNEIEPRNFHYILLFMLAEIAAMKDNFHLLSLLLRNPKQFLNEKIFEPISNSKSMKNPVCLRKIDRFIALIAAAMTEAQKSNLMTEESFITSLLRNYSLDALLKLETGEVKIVFSVIDDGQMEGFPNVLEFIVLDLPEAVNWNSIVLNIKSSINPTALLNILKESLRFTGNSTIYNCSPEMMVMLTKLPNVQEFLTLENVKFSLSNEAMKRLLKMSFDPKEIILLMIPLNSNILTEILLSAKSKLELRNLEAITGTSIDRLFLNTLNNWPQSLNEFSYFDIRPVIKYWIRGPNKWSINEIQVDYLKSMITQEFPDEMARIIGRN